MGLGHKAKKVSFSIKWVFFKKLIKQRIDNVCEQYSYEFCIIMVIFLNIYNIESEYKWQLL